MDLIDALFLFIFVPLTLLGGMTETEGDRRPDCGDAVASQEVCEQVVARAGEVGTVPETHEQRDRARGD